MSLTESKLSKGAAPKEAAPKTLGCLLLDSFTLISLASAIEPLRMANKLSGRELYNWYTLSEDGASLKASDGLLITPDASLDTALNLDWIMVCGGIGPDFGGSRKQRQWLQSQSRQLRRLGAVCTGSWVLAKAGLLDGYETSIHWECLTAMQAAFPRVNLNAHLFTVDRDRFTASGGTAPLDMMLNLVRRDHGRKLAASISEMCIYERIRGAEDQQRIPLKHLLGTAQPKLVDCVAIMEANLEDPLRLDELAAYVQLSRRQLERLFVQHLQCTPSRYYLKLRLFRAQQLLQQTSLSIIEVSAACGFVSTPHFSRCYREFFHRPPRSERRLTDNI